MNKKLLCLRLLIVALAAFGLSRPALAADVSPPVVDFEPRRAEISDLEQPRDTAPDDLRQSAPPSGANAGLPDSLENEFRPTRPDANLEGF